MAPSEEFSFGRWLKRRRQARDLTQDALSVRAGCATPTLQKIEQGARKPSRALLSRLLDALDVSAAEREALVRQARGDTGGPQAQPTHLIEALAAAELPPEPTPFVGRADELAGLTQLLAGGAARLVTIVGPGGMGKTRLALRAAYLLAQKYADRAGWVALAAVPSADLLLPSVAAALGLTFPASADVEAHLLRALRDRHMLLVLDNIEHMAGDLAPLGRLIAAAPNVQLLATSRVRLNVREEWVWELGGLPLPQPGGPALPDGAAALFAQSARKVRQDFALDQRDSPAIAQICALVGGMPLGIELAAAWSRLLSPQEIAAELARGVGFLSGSQANVEARHRSLAGVFRASWALLSPDEQAVARRLAVFRGGFTREAAEAVATASLPQLLALVDKSFVRRAAAGPGEWRFDMHELIRQHAGEQLAERPDEQRDAHARHGRFFAELLARAEPDLKGAGQRAALGRLRAEIHNLRAAWGWLIEQRQAGAIRRGAPALAYFYELQAWNQEGARAIGRAADALALGAAAPTPDEAVAYGICRLNAGWFLMRLGETARSHAEVSASVGLLRAQDDRLSLANALFGLGYLATMLGRYDEARAALAEGAGLARAADHPWMAAIILTTAGTAARIQGRAADAAGLLDEARRYWRRTGEPRGTAWCLNEIGALLLASGRHGEAEAALQESLALSAGLADPWSSGTAYVLLGHLAALRQEQAEARWLLGQSLALFRSMDASAESVHVLLDLAGLDLADRAPQRARRRLEDALGAAEAAAAAPLVLTVLAQIARLLAADGDLGRARELCARILADPAARQADRDAAAEIAGSPAGPPPPAWSLAEAVAAGLAALRAPAGSAEPTPAPAGGPSPFVALAEPLTPREREVLRLLAAGASNPEIAARLTISPHTAKVHVARILAKLGASSRTEAALRARDLGLI